MPDEYINGLRVVQNGQKSLNLNLSNARKKTYAQLQQMTDEQKKGVIIVEDYPVPEDSDFVEVKADGEKNWATLLGELNSLVNRDKIGFNTCLSADGHIFRLISGGAALYFDAMNNLSSGAYNLCIKLSPNPTYTTWEIKSNGNNFVDNSITGIPAKDTKITLYYDYYKNLDIHTEYLATNCMYDTNTNVKQKIDAKEDKSDLIIATVNSTNKTATFPVDTTALYYVEIGVSSQNTSAAIIAISKLYSNICPYVLAEKYASDCQISSISMSGNNVVLTMSTQYFYNVYVKKITQLE